MVSGSATITGGTGSYAGFTSSTLTASGTVTGSLLSGGTLSLSISGTVITGGPIITQIYNSSRSNHPLHESEIRFHSTSKGFSDDMATDRHRATPSLGMALDAHPC